MSIEPGLTADLNASAAPQSPSAALQQSLPSRDQTALQREALVRDLRALQGYHSVLLVGGTFDPFTRAHLDVPHHVAEMLGIEAVLYIPAQQNPLKSMGPQASAADRLEMIRQTLREEPHSYVSPLELERAGRSFTVDTLREARTALGSGCRIFLFMGSDCLARLPEWKDLDEIWRLCTIIPVARGESPESCLDALRGKLTQERVSELRRNFIDIGVPPISATMARERLGRGEIPWDLLPPAVAARIEERGLYGYAANH